MPKVADRHHEREREKKRRRRRDDSYDDYEDEGGISGWKLGLVVGVIVVCFAMLYPTLFHPMLMGFLGRSSQPAPSINQQRPPIHPAMGGGGGQRHPGGHPSRPDVHPAMRMAQAQAAGESGGSKGMFTWMLPIYTIGVVLFLLYTLFKSKGKKSKRKRRNNYFDSEEDEDDDESEAETKYGGKFGKKKLRGLQERLRQTEDAMSKILEQLETVQASAKPMDLNAADKLIEQFEDGTAEKESVGLTETNEQYIKDLEVALKEFQSLSKAYDKEKMKKLKRSGSSSEEEEEEEEEEEDAVEESELSEIEEEEEEEEQKPVKKVVEKKKPSKKIRQKSTSEEEEDGKEEARKAEEDAEEEEGIDIDSEIRAQAERDKKDKNVRRRRPKKT
ncbi:hypothetical protein CAEBREN_03934 [Caenorhabditis brenneri]|uniref:Resistance to inhibitors of cholinesterase protein 3 N-terminal domain-containing protein n=1 Tax=Caenorhabditis brenneri TaxID=135651 RepID=G0P240_CAEBE|nr:hypothetical protein CAEBREN_03934 [Caenorhabditis brenneri]